MTEKWRSHQTRQQDPTSDGSLFLTKSGSLETPHFTCLPPAMSQFSFLHTEWPDILDAASKAESLAFPDPRTACFYARRALELAVFWLYKSDSTLRLPYQQHLSALIHEPTFRTVVGPAILAKTRVIKELGNLA